MIDFRDSYKPGEARTIDKMPRARKKSLYLSILCWPAVLLAGAGCLAALLVIWVALGYQNMVIRVALPT